MPRSRYFWELLESHGTSPALISSSEGEISYNDLAARADYWTEQYKNLLPKSNATQLLIAIEISADVEIIAAHLGALRGGHAVLLTEAAAMAPTHPIRMLYRPNVHVRLENGKCVAIPGDSQPVELDSSLRVLLSTSGTTGEPKLVRLSDQNIAANAKSIAEYLGLSSSERAILTLPLYYSYGMSVLHAHLAAGGSLVLTDHSITTREFWDLFKQTQATSMALVPHQFDLLEKTGFDQMKLPSLRYITQAGGRLFADKVQEFSELGEKAGWRLFVMYGQTEASPRISYIPPEQLATNGDTIGQAIPDGRLWLEDDTHKLIEDSDVAGELFYEGPNVMMGYANTRDELALGDDTPVLATGDIAVRTADGYFKIVGRKKRFVKLFGLRLSLDQMEQSLSAVNLQGYCISVDDHLVVLHEKPDDQETIKAHLAKTYKLQPDLIVTQLLEKTPLLSSGKLDLKALQGEAEQAIELDQVATTPVDLREAIKFATRSVSVVDSDTYIGLGGDSLGYLQVTISLEDKLGYIPEDWDEMPIASLEKLKPVSGNSGSLSIDVIVRLIAVIMIVLHHVYISRLSFTAGGTWALLIIVGYSLARFSRGPIINGKPFKAIFKLLYPFLALYYVILIAVVAIGKHVEPSMFYLTNNIGFPDTNFLFSPNWFVSLYVQIIVGMVAILSIPPITRWIRRDPWLAGIWGFALAISVSFLYQLSIQPFLEAIVDDRELIEQLTANMRTPITCIPFIMVGWCICFAKSSTQKWIAAMIVILNAVVFPGTSITYSLTSGVLGLLFLSGWSFSVPKRVSSILRTAAGTTLFVYLLHGGVVHVFKYATSWSDHLGIFWSSVAVVLSSFLISLIAQRIFDGIEKIMRAYWQRYVERRKQKLNA